MITYDEFKQLARWAGFDEPTASDIIVDNLDWYYAQWKLVRLPNESDTLHLSYYANVEDETRSYACLETVNYGGLRPVYTANSPSKLKSMLEPYRKAFEGHLKDHADDAIGWIDRRLFEAAFSNPDLFGHISYAGEPAPNTRVALAAICSHKFTSIAWKGNESDDAIEFIRAAGFRLPDEFQSSGIGCIVPRFLKQGNITATIIEDHSADGDLPWLSLSTFINTDNPVFPQIETSIPLAAEISPDDDLAVYETLVSDLYQFDFGAPNWIIYGERDTATLSSFDVNMSLDDAWDDCITKSMQVLQGEYGTQDKNEER